MKKDGAMGLFKGIGKGLTGLVSKPITGVLDGVSKTAEVIKNMFIRFSDVYFRVLKTINL